MAAITGTKITKTPTTFSGELKIVVLTAPVASASDAITIAVASHGITSIVGVMGVMTDGMDAGFSDIQVSHTSTAITVESVEADGTDASDFTGTTVEIWVLGY